MANFLGVERRFNGRGLLSRPPSLLVQRWILILGNSRKIDYNTSERIFTNKQRDRENLHYR
jgi:hypothetical protein